MNIPDSRFFLMETRGDFKSRPVKIGVDDFNESVNPEAMTQEKSNNENAWGRSIVDVITLQV